MTECGYSDEFLILICASDAIQVITNDVQIRLILELDIGGDSPQGLSERLRIPITTVQSSLRILEEKEIVWGRYDQADRRRRRYYLCSKLILSNILEKKTGNIVGDEPLAELFSS